ncbi:type II toxin-antitoxin system HigA family antitoxin [Dyadobacter sp. CY343]|uniref:helix-turn-helix domain-containing protein n=1 Tax=Dyadobacter sp. CY343 TaxID=2907299 RepID=UPI001F3DCCA0|nr:transcriptional regulator [Dyadobacter sp. CY343]MCE7062433.1 transcriptional regulator [Dyadobacter sp. CY343]
MEALKYKIIKNKEQYELYCGQLETLLEEVNSQTVQDEIELLTFLIEKYDEEVNTMQDVDPITLLNSLMQDHNLRAKDLVEILSVSKGYVSDILHYRKGLSKEVIRSLSEYFKINQKAFNRPYELRRMQARDENVAVY